MRGIVRAYRKLSPNPRKFPGRGEHKLGNLLPIIMPHRVHVQFEREGVHADFRVIVVTHERWSLNTDCPIA
jgi:hypothetical protein